MIHNPKAGRGRRARRLADILRLFNSHGYNMRLKELSFGNNPFDGDEDVELVVICGGDGTINHVVNKMFKKGINPTLGIIPMGTANDFANALHMPRRHMEAARKILHGTPRNVDCCKVNDRYFVNVFSFGMLTTASQRTPRIAKRHFGKLAYIKTGINDLNNMQSTHVKLTIGDKVIEENILTFLVFNGITAGRLPLTRNAKIDDGQFDIVILRNRNKVLSYGNIVRYILGDNPDDILHIRCSEILVESADGCITDVDGERGPRFPLTITCEHKGLTIKY